jgi:hypothetical protein
MRRSYANEVRNPCGRRGGEDGDEDAVYEQDNDGEGDEDKEASINFKRDGVALRCAVQKDCSATGDGEDGVELLNEGEVFDDYLVPAMVIL